MVTDISLQADKEIQNIASILLNNGFEQLDVAYFEFETPFTIHPDIRNIEYRNKTGVVFYPELLFYDDPKLNPITYSAVPWICAKIEIEGEWIMQEQNQYEFAKWVIQTFKDMGFSPFHDEDAFGGYFRRNVHKGWVSFKFYINESYPKGYWENHTL